MDNGRNWCFTLNNWSDIEYTIIDNFMSKNSVKYAIVGKEKAPETGTMHLQGMRTITHRTGYVSFRNRRLLNGVRKGISMRAHFEIAKGDAESNKLYCSKEGDFKEWGSVPRQGERSDLQAIGEQVVKGTLGLDQIMAEHPGMFMRNHGGLSKLTTRFCPPVQRTSAPLSAWLYGPTGTGKTAGCVKWAELMGIGYYKKQKQTPYWDGYVPELHPLIIIDDFRASMGSFAFMLDWLDRYSCSVNQKYGGSPLNSPYIIITCPKHPKDVWPQYRQGEDHLDQLYRRLGEGGILHYAKGTVFKPEECFLFPKKFTDLIPQEAMPGDAELSDDGSSDGESSSSSDDESSSSSDSSSDGSVAEPGCPDGDPGVCIIDQDITTSCPSTGSSLHPISTPIICKTTQYHPYDGGSQHTAISVD